MSAKARMIAVKVVAEFIARTRAICLMARVADNQIAMYQALKNIFQANTLIEDARKLIRCQIPRPQISPHP